MHAPQPLSTLRASLTPRPAPTTPTIQEPVDDRHERQAEATIRAIAQERRELEALRADRDRLHDLNAAAAATIRTHEDTIRNRDGEIARLNALVNSWQHEAARLQGVIEVGVAALLQAAGKNETGAGAG